jgi:hypothetical protein
MKLPLLIYGARIRGRRSKQLPDDLKENTRYCNFKEEALDCTLWRSLFGRGYGHVARQTTKLMNSRPSKGGLGKP